jgi:micrococcal nuclease
MELYNYGGQVTKIIDGDTIEANIDLGFGIFYAKDIRINGIDAPEVHSANPKEKEAGQKVKAYLKTLLQSQTVSLKTYKYGDKYGRFLADIELFDKSSVAKLLLDQQLVHPYDGKTKKEWTDLELDFINIRLQRYMVTL